MWCTVKRAVSDFRRSCCRFDCLVLLWNSPFPVGLFPALTSFPPTRLFAPVPSHRAHLDLVVVPGSTCSISVLSFLFCQPEILFFCLLLSFYLGFSTPTHFIWTDLLVTVWFPCKSTTFWTLPCVPRRARVSITVMTLTKCLARTVAREVEQDVSACNSALRARIMSGLSSLINAFCRQRLQINQPSTTCPAP